MPQLIIGISVVVVLMASAITAYNPVKRTGQANDARRLQDITALARALENYQLDNDQLPSDFSSLNIWDTHKVVLCSSSGSLTCDGQTRNCLVVDDTDFIGEYVPSLPIDPKKDAITDTGYYVTRDNDRLAFGVCDTYDDDGLEYVAKVSLATYNATCGDGAKEGDEVCDDGNTNWETCGNAQIDDAGTHCNPTCTGTTYISVDENCDSDPPGGECYMNGEYYYANDFTYRPGGDPSCGRYSTGCRDDCVECIGFCEA